MSTPDAQPGPVDRHGFWLRTLAMYDLVFVGMSAVYLVAVLVQTDAFTEARVAVATMLVLALAYVLVGRRAARRGSARLADAYLAVLVVVVVVQVAGGDIGSVLLFLAYTQIWFFARTRAAGVVWAVALTVAITVAAVLRVGATGQEITEIAAQFGTALMFAVVLGLWITQIAEQSEERAYLLEELSAAQDALAASHHAAGAVAERERLAAEIHDTLAQGFTSVVMLAQTAAVELERGRTERAADGLARIEDVARDNLAEARALVAAWAPPDLRDGDLGGALHRIATRFGAQTGADVEVEDGTREDGAGAIGPEAQVVLLRVAQESLANVRRHAGATRVTLHLARADRTVVLEVVDDGCGMPADVAEGTGLRGMRARAEAVGGRLDVGQAPGGGTRVRVLVPGLTDASDGADPVAEDGAHAPEAAGRSRDDDEPAVAHPAHRGTARPGVGTVP